MYKDLFQKGKSSYIILIPTTVTSLINLDKYLKYVIKSKCKISFPEAEEKKKKI